MPVTILKVNPNTYAFNGILYRVKTCSLDSKTFRSIHYLEILSMADWFYRTFKRT